MKSIGNFVGGILIGATIVGLGTTFFTGSYTVNSKSGGTNTQVTRQKVDLKKLKTPEERQKYLDDLLQELDMPEVEGIYYDPKLNKLNGYLKKVSMETKRSVESVGYLTPIILPLIGTHNKMPIFIAAEPFEDDTQEEMKLWIKQVAYAYVFNMYHGVHIKDDLHLTKHELMNVSAQAIPLVFHLTSHQNGLNYFKDKDSTVHPRLRNQLQERVEYYRSKAKMRVDHPGISEYEKEILQELGSK